MPDGQMISWTIPPDLPPPAEGEPGGPPSLYPSPQESVRPDLNFFIYYQRPKRGHDDDGWIVPKPGWPNERAKWTKKGWIPLDQYGKFVPGEDSRDVRNVKFSAFRESYRVFFQKGGAPAMPVSQIIAYGWHRRKPYREVEFPQLEGVTWTDYLCPACATAPFNAALHLADHLTIRHKWSWADLREYGKSMGYDFTRSAGAVSKPAVPQPAPPPVMDMTPIEAPNDLTCSECGWRPAPTNKRPVQAVNLHRRNAHKSAALAAVS